MHYISIYEHYTYMSMSMRRLEVPRQKTEVMTSSYELVIQSNDNRNSNIINVLVLIRRKITCAFYRL